MITSNKIGKYFFFLFSILVQNISAQTGLGFLSSNYCGVSTIKFNPAIADNNMQFDMNLGSCNLTGSNNAGGIHSDDFFNSNFNREFFSSEVKANSLFTSFMITPIRSRNNYFFYKNAEVQGPLSLMVNFGKDKKNALGFSYNYNVIKNFSANSNGLVMLTLPYENLPNSFSSANFSIKSLSWIDIGITYSRVLIKKPLHLFKFGTTLKYVIGTGYVNSQGSDINFSNNYDGTGNITGNLTYNESSSHLISNTSTFNSAPLNPGFATDIGFVYEWRPKLDKYYYEMDSVKNNLRNDKDIYTLRIAFSVTDLGFVSQQHQSITPTFIYENFSKSDFNSILLGNFNSNQFSSGASKNVNFLLPMRFNFSFDYNIGKGFGLNLIGRISPVMKNISDYIRHPSDIVFTPRVDLKWFGFYLPLSYDFNNNVSFGAAARFGPVFLGFDNFLMFMQSGVYKGGAYAAVKIPIPFYKPRDKDKDLVSIKYDLCLKEPGTWLSKGCPDKDGDGVRDEEDLCVTEAGTILNHGCPDRDGDGIADKDDKCPDNMGPANLLGCPDTDGDGVIDLEDSCIDVAGEKAMFGCPDNDDDGVPYFIDKCPNVKGDPNHHGCPDTDKDGVYDDEDPCVTESGPISLKGCPWEDSDGDGVFDNEDSCVFDKGLKSNFGCPQIKVPKRSDLSVCRDTLFFDTYLRTLNILNTSKLDILVKELNNNNSYNVRIIGYVDDSECDSSDYEFLSKERAKSVYIYFLEHGIARNRLSYDGYGNENPAGDKKTWSGKRKNRRVEIYFQFATSY